MKTNSYTQLCAVLGHPVRHSMSPAIHMAAFEKAGMNAQYLAFDVLPKDLRAAIDAMRAFGIQEYAVTIPHKEKIIKYLDRIDPVARTIGAVNTVVNKKGILYGYNTDIDGIEHALKGVRLRHARVALLGAGGAARPAAHLLKQKGAYTTVFDLKPTSLGDEWRTYEDIAYVQEVDIIIHTTPVGMAPKTKACLVPERYLQKGQIVFDVVYTPMETELLKRAKRKEARTISGSEMFLWQAVRQFELWTGKKAPVKEMKQALLKTIL